MNVFYGGILEKLVNPGDEKLLEVELSLHGGKALERLFARRLDDGVLHAGLLLVENLPIRLAEKLELELDAQRAHGPFKIADIHENLVEADHRRGAADHRFLGRQRSVGVRLYRGGSTPGLGEPLGNRLHLPEGMGRDRERRGTKHEDEDFRNGTRHTPLRWYDYTAGRRDAFKCKENNKIWGEPRDLRVKMGEIREPMPHPKTALFAFFFTMLGLAAPGLSDEVPDIGEPPNKAIQQSSTVDGEEREYAVESEHRREMLYPSNYGHAGIFRIRSAESLPAGTLTFGIGGEFYAINNAPNFGFAGSQAETIAESLFVGYAPWEHVTFGLQRRNSSTTFGNPQQLISSLGDFTFSTMYSIPINQAMAIAPIGSVLIASNFNSLAPAGTTLSAGLGAAFTFTLFPTTGIPLFTHANVIYNMPQIRTSKATTGIEPESFFNFSRYHTVTLGLGAEYKIGSFIPFLEYNQTIHASSQVSFGNSPSKVSLGSRFMPLENKSLALLLGADIGLGKGIAAGVPFSPDYQIIGQVSYTVAVSNTERKHYYTTKDVNIVDRKFIINRNINFKVGSAILEPSSEALLDQIATVIKENDVKKLMIVGHTDSTAKEDYNLKLSTDRANTVKRYLTAKGIPEETFLTQGYGKRKPKASNATEEGRSQNRRVEFFILE